MDHVSKPDLRYFGGYGSRCSSKIKAHTCNDLLWHDQSADAMPIDQGEEGDDVSPNCSATMTIFPDRVFS